MKVNFKVNDKMTIEVEGKTQVEVFEKIAEAQEVFDNLYCPATKSNNIQFVVREDKDENKYYELKDKTSGYKLAFGQHKKGGTLFPRRKDTEGNWIDNQGWTKWEGKKEEAAAV